MAPTPRRTVLLLRLALYATALLVALGIYLISSHEATPSEPSYGTQLTGKTDEARPAFLVARHGKPVRLQVVWTSFRCTGAARRREAVVVNFNAMLDRFERHGATFSVARTEAPPGDGARERASAAGRIGVDGRSAHGTADARIDRYRDGRLVGTCRSRPVGWRVRRI
jgi:hypothetical protein